MIEQAIEEADITEFVGPRAAEIDRLKIQESKVLSEINEEVERLRKLSKKSVEDKLDQLNINDDYDDEY